LNSFSGSPSRHNLRPCIHPNRRYNESPSLQPRKRRLSRLKCASESVPTPQPSLLPRCAPRFQSKVWLFCEKFYDETGERKAKCRLCNAVINARVICAFHVLCYSGGSTRGILHHLRTVHADVTRGVIQPVVKKPLALVGGIDVNDDEAWVQEIDDEADSNSNAAESVTAQLPEYQDKQGQQGSCSNKDKEQGLDYATLTSEETPSYAGEVFLQEDGSYVTEEGDEFVDVVYVQEGELDEELSKHSAQTFIPRQIKKCSSTAQAAEKREVCTQESSPSVPDRMLKASDKQMIARNGVSGTETHFEMPDYTLVDYRGQGWGRHVYDREGALGTGSAGNRLMPKTKWRGIRQHDPPLDIDDHFGNVVSLSLKTLPVEQRPRARAAILQCIAEFRESAVEEGHS
uniref:BED-type domain-containing protein n=1 Tax=Toxocara canis TaxID=6265 RepID=A0A183UE34_TOXCA